MAATKGLLIGGLKVRDAWKYAVDCPGKYGDLLGHFRQSKGTLEDTKCDAQGTHGICPV